MSNWRETTLGKVANVFTGYPFKSELYSTGDQDVRLLRGDNISQGAMDWSDARKWSAEQLKDFEDYQLKEDDIVLAMDRPWIGAGLKFSQIIKSDLPALLVQRTARLRGSNDLDIGYLKYVIGSPWFTSYIKRITTGSLVPHISLKQIRDFPVKLPPIEEQKAAAAVLLTIDKKIELNNRINAELEAMAKTLYDYWFVQFDFPDDSPLGQSKPYKTTGGKMVYNPTLKREIPEGWEDSTIGEIEPNIVTGKTPSKDNSEYFGGNVPFITIGDIRGNTYIVSTEETLTASGAATQKNKFLPEDSICVTCIASPGLVGFVTTPAQTNQQINSVVCSNEINKYYLYFAIKGYFEGAKAKTGNTFSNMNKGDFSAIEILKPSEQALQNYHQKVYPLFQQLKIKSLETQLLAKLRDWLLPMLMNGQVTVK